MDERLRSLERRAASGDPRADADLLRHRVAMRDLPRRRLRLAAVLGYAPACWVDEAAPLARGDQGVSKWLRTVEHYGGDEAAARANLHAAELVLPRWEQAFPGDRAPHRVLELAWTCVRSPSVDAARKVRRAANHTQAYLRTLGPVLAVSPFASSACRTADDVSPAHRALALRAGQASTHAGLEAAALVKPRNLGPFGSALEIASDLEGEAIVFAAVGEALVRWALGNESSDQRR